MKNSANRDLVSVPSGDFLFFNDYGRFDGRPAIMFPSPLGTSYFLITLGAFFTGRFYAFPSPLGTSYFLIGTQKHCAENCRVSVPSGDFLFFNEDALKYSRKGKHVSVPSGDFLFFNTQKQLKEMVENGFRPLWGLLIF